MASFEERIRKTCPTCGFWIESALLDNCPRDGHEMEDRIRMAPTEALRLEDQYNQLPLEERQADMQKARERIAAKEAIMRG